MLQIKRRIIPRARGEKRVTSVLISGPLATIRMEIEDRMAAQGRREVALSFFRQMRPWLYFFSCITLRHPGQIDPVKTGKYSTWIYNRNPIWIEEQRFPLEVRLNRLVLGWTQAELANQARISRARLSEIESLKRKPTRRIQEKIIQALRDGYVAQNPKRNKKRTLGHERANSRPDRRIPA